MTITRSMIINGIGLTLFTITATAMVAFISAATKERVAKREQQILTEKLHKLISPDMHDNALDRDVIAITNPLLGSNKPQFIYRARKQTQPVATILHSIAPHGYSGNIDLLVAIHYDGTLAGVRVTHHKETPGLGDPIEENKSRWIFQFDNKSLLNPNVENWRVKKDRGQFDQITSATITSRAVTKAVYNTLQFYQQQREMIFQTPAIPEHPKAK